MALEITLVDQLEVNFRETFPNRIRFLLIFLGNNSNFRTKHGRNGFKFYRNDAKQRWSTS